MLVLLVGVEVTETVAVTVGDFIAVGAIVVFTVFVAVATGVFIGVPGDWVSRRPCGIGAGVPVLPLVDPARLVTGLLPMDSVSTDGLVDRGAGAGLAALNADEEGAAVVTKSTTSTAKRTDAISA